mgnify:CR=1 FL=1
MRRTMLFLPGNSPNMVLNGAVLGSDSIIFDLEDAVSPEQKDAARILVRNVLKHGNFEGCEVIVRINALDTPYWEDDVEAIVPLKPDMIMPTKVSGADYIKKLSAKMAEVEEKHGLPVGGIRLIPLLETTLGIENAYQIATADSRMEALYLGAEDLTADLRCKRTKKGDEIFYSRSRLVCAARAAGIEAYDTPFTAVDDLEGLEADAMFAKSLGFTGKAVISPRHVESGLPCGRRDFLRRDAVSAFLHTPDPRWRAGGAFHRCRPGGRHFALLRWGNCYCGCGYAPM